MLQMNVDSLISLRWRTSGTRKGVGDLSVTRRPLEQEEQKIRSYTRMKVTRKYIMFYSINMIIISTPTIWSLEGCASGESYVCITYDLFSCCIAPPPRIWFDGYLGSNFQPIFPHKFYALIFRRKWFVVIVAFCYIRGFILEIA